ncbi:hypothetical protein JZ751_029249 [Albula glossodonta]|uniref:Uncharacterized protein n=1 Tax=Albula glossodonta TaxID=121402 RepID=A0A8T2PH30_9TELE|nr:hypothetical protein JZ751_029249 [Albula glossodonta]
MEVSVFVTRLMSNAARRELLCNFLPLFDVILNTLHLWVRLIIIIIIVIIVIVIIIYIIIIITIIISCLLFVNYLRMYLENKGGREVEMSQTGGQSHQGRSGHRASDAVAGNFDELRLLKSFSEMMDSQKLQQGVAAPPGHCVIYAEDFGPIREEEGHNFNVIKFLKGKSKQGPHTENTPLLRFSPDDSISHMTLHDPSFSMEDESWDGSSMELERRCRLGSEVAGLSRSTSTEKCDPLDNLHLNFTLSSRISLSSVSRGS